MSSVSVVGRGGVPLLRVTVARALGPVVALALLGVALAALAQAAPPALPGWPLAVLVLLGVWSAIDPEGPAALLTIVSVVALWGTAVAGDATAWAFVGAVGLLGFHLAVAHLAAGPPGCVASPAVVAALVRDGLVVVAATGLVAVVALAAAGGVSTPGAAVAVVALLVAGLPWLAWRLVPRPVLPPTSG